MYVKLSCFLESKPKFIFHLVSEFLDWQELFNYFNEDVPSQVGCLLFNFVADCSERGSRLTTYKHCCLKYLQ